MFFNITSITYMFVLMYTHFFEDNIYIYIHHYIETLHNQSISLSISIYI